MTTDLTLIPSELPASVVIRCDDLAQRFPGGLLLAIQVRPLASGVNEPSRVFVVVDRVPTEAILPIECIELSFDRGYREDRWGRDWSYEERTVTVTARTPEWRDQTGQRRWSIDLAMPFLEYEVEIDPNDVRHWVLVVIDPAEYMEASKRAEQERDPDEIGTALPPLLPESTE